MSWVKIALGVLLLLVAAGQFRGRPQGDDQLLAMLGSGGTDGIQFDADPRTLATVTAFAEHAVSAFAIVTP